MNDLVSIIIPVYEVVWDDFTRCIDSCILQSYKNIEILIMCNGCSQSLIGQIKTLALKDSRIKVFKCHKGVSNARNEGIKLSIGDWIAFVDADDYIALNYIEKLHDVAINTSSDITICSFYKEYKNTSEKIQIISDEILNIDSNNFLEKILNVENGVGFVWGKLWNSYFLKNNNILFNSELKVVEDAEFCLKSLKYCPTVSLIKDALYHYVFSNSSTVRKFDKNYSINFESAMISIKNTLQHIKYNSVDWSNFVTYHLLLICVNYCFNNNNLLNYRQQKILLKNELKKPIFKFALKESRLKDFSLTRRITLFALKFQMFGLVKLISIIRNKQR